MIYFLRVHSRYFYPVKAYFSDWDKLLSYVKYFLENPEFISDEDKAAYDALPPRRKKHELQEIFSIMKVDKVRRYNYRDLFIQDGVKRVGEDEAKDEGSKTKVQNAANDKNRKDGGGESEDSELPDAA